ncbi:Potassium transporter [Neofusicoccum parvum]|uniref:Potassium transporter n=2 Tax=Neofusicoccum parvum TaxID=310453 RepID=A0ACB5S394_9PEZI|nr:putative potassium uptake protein [Neofusicoccum parvum UCRNP2]GME27227.1 Potassium transporter [Neofusicoccum parvum]GME57268.1 Potassium transporter [Neofusicoccum parvum]
MEDDLGDLKHLTLFQGSGPAARLKHRSSKSQLKEKDVDLVYDEEDTIDYRPQERDFKHKQVFKGWPLFWLAYQSTGVIYGDIGTSPLYVFSSTFSDEPDYNDLMGALSLIIWSITLIVTIKYVLIVLGANDEGEGGTFAIYSLLSRYCDITKHDPKRKHTHRLTRFESNELRPLNQRVRDFLENSRAMHFMLKALSVFGVSLILADTILTPAQSVLGAVQGLRVVRPDLGTDLIIGVSCAIIVLLFFLQPLGISRLAKGFAPIVVVWLLLNFCFGIYNLVKFDESVLKAFSPYFAFKFFMRDGTNAFYSLGGILLAFTGVEALFADLGAFSQRQVSLYV